MARRSRKGRFCDILIFVIVVGLMLVNIYLTMSYFHHEAHENSAPQGRDASIDAPAVNHKHSERIEKAHPSFVASTSWHVANLDELIRRSTPEKFWGPNVSLSDEGVPQLFDSATFDRVPAQEDWKAAYRMHETLRRSTGCNLLSVPFLPHQDDKCIAYLKNISNWKTLKPLPMLFDQRTIKFEVEFLPIADETTNEPLKLGLSSILKMPQRLFPNEAFGEVGAYVADRVLEINRVPPTGAVCIPVTTIRQSVDRFGRDVETVSQFLQESHAANYAEWVTKDLIEFVERGHGFDVDSDGVQCITCSIQLRVADVARLLDSALKIPYVPHNESWFRYLDLANHHTSHNRPLYFHDPFLPTIVHISELNAFDFVIGNGDRSPNKNNFVVGGCIRSRECGNRLRDPLYLRHPNHPTFVHLDQGMSFYGSPRRNPIAAAVSAHKDSPTADDTFCLFRAPLLNRLTYLNEAAAIGREAVSRFEQQMEDKLPSSIRRFITSHMLKQCHDRIVKLLHLASRCLSISNHAIRGHMIAP